MSVETKPAFTPGPWHWADTEALRDDGEHDIIGIYARAYADSSRCEINVDDDDARLIAAAPQLYERLSETANHIKSLLDRGVISDAADANALGARYRMACAALAAATGDQR